MKRLLIAFSFLALGTTAFAAESKTSKPADKTVEMSFAPKDIKSLNKVNRVQYHYRIWDQCGGTWDVWMSGPNGSTYRDLFKHAVYYILANSGC